MAVHSYSKISIIDNSGALFGRCIQTYWASKRCGARVGSVILVTLKLVIPDKKIKQGDLSKALVVCSRDWVSRFSSYRLKAHTSSVALVYNASLLPRGKRARGIMLEEAGLRFSQSVKTLALASMIV